MVLEVVVLAAGAGTRMRSRLPKVLHPLAGRPLLAHVLDATSSLEPRKIHVVIGEQGDAIKAHFAARNLSWVVQEPRRGTGDALAKALPRIADDARVLVLLGDAPLIDAETLTACVRRAASGLGVVTAKLADPAGFGRVLRDGGKPAAIVEERDASQAQRAIDEVNTGIFSAPKSVFAELLPLLEPRNAATEYYLTGIVGLARARDIEVTAIDASCPEEALGVNDRAQLARLERYWQRREAARLMQRGVTVLDPDRLDVRGRLRTGRDCVIDVGVVFEGDVTLGDEVRVGAGCVIRDSSLGDGVEVEPMSCIDGARVAAGCHIGPYARLRPGTELAESVHIGNFVEIKQARLGAGTKASHLSYLGDASLGDQCNVGAGVVTCNYDGVGKHRTDVGDGVFIGTNSTLVAPLTVEQGAYVGAGSTITSRVCQGDLAIGRGRQRNIQGWTPPAKRRRDQDGDGD